MIAFVVHRTPMRRKACDFLSSLAQSNGIYITPIFLKKSYGDFWQEQAESKIQSSEVVIIYDSDACHQSENANWEINRAKELGKPVIELSSADITKRNINELKSVYEFSEEFDCCFDNQLKNQTQLFELYKIMVASSEQLIQRRQITNGFFITVISAIIGVCGIVLNEEILNGSNILVFIFPLVIGLLMCRSWGNLIENYGKLNKGKFHVIHRIEKSLDAQIFAAEWIALGKGLRDEKYESFTSTEQNVPRLFSYLLWVVLGLTIFSADWHSIGNNIQNIFYCLSPCFSRWIHA